MDTKDTKEEKVATDMKEANGSKKKEEGQAAVRKGPKALARVVLLVAAVAGALWGGTWILDAVSYVDTDDAAIDGRQVKLSPKMLGRVAEIKTAEGERVTAGQVLATLDDRDLRAQEAQALSSLAYARANLSVAKVNLDKCEEDAARVARLYAAQATTKENQDHAQKALDAARAQYALTQAAVDTSNAQLGVIEAQLLNASLSTPIDGTVEKVSLNPGDLAQPGQAVLSVNNLDELWITANFEETKIGKVRKGAAVRISIDAYPGRVFEGEVAMIRPGIVPPAFQIGTFTKTTQRVPVRIRIVTPIEGLGLVPGLSVEVKVRTPASLPWTK